MQPTSLTMAEVDKVGLNPQDRAVAECVILSTGSTEVSAREFITLLGGGLRCPSQQYTVSEMRMSVLAARHLLIGFLTSTVAGGVQKSRPTDGPTRPARRTRFLGVDRCEQLFHRTR